MSCSAVFCMGRFHLNAPPSLFLTIQPPAEEEAHKVNPKIKSGAALTLKSLKETAHSVKSLMVAKKRAGGVNFMG